jgi:hypothetical protein
MNRVTGQIASNGLHQQDIQGAHLGFRRAFYDFATCAIYVACDRHGNPTDFHSYDGLPDEVILRRGFTGRVLSVKSTLIAGFERNGFFYTQAAAARAIAEWFVPNGGFAGAVDE